MKFSLLPLITATCVQPGPRARHLLATLWLATAGTMFLPALAQSAAPQDQSSAAPPPTPSQVELTQEVDRLVAELDAPQLARRNAAEKGLIALGPDAASLLPASDTALSPEAKQRLKRVREQIARHSAGQQINRQTDSLVRLGDADSLEEALEAISRDSGIEFEHMAAPETKITPYSTPLPFWHSLDHVLDQARLDIDFYGSEGTTLSLQPRTDNRTSRVDAAAYAGLYRLEPLIVTSRRVLRDSSLSGMNVEVELSWRPDLHPVGITLPLAQITAKLDDGAVVKAQNTKGTIDLSPPDDLATATLQLPLELPAGRPAKIEALAGKIQSMLPGPVKSFEFSLAAGSQTRSEQFVTVKLEEIRKNGALHEVRLGVEYKNPGKAMESHRGWLLSNEIFVRMPDGSRQEHLGYELYRHNEAGIGIGYMFDIGDTVTDRVLIYNTPTAVIQNEIDFVIQDIPMP